MIKDSLLFSTESLILTGSQKLGIVWGFEQVDLVEDLPPIFLYYRPSHIFQTLSQWENEWIYLFQQINIIQSNLNGSNIFGTMEIRSRHG